MTIIDWIKGYRHVTHQESEGVDLAVRTIKKFEGRTFTFRGLKKKYDRLDSERLIEKLQAELDSMLMMYRYMTRVKTFTNRKGVCGAIIKLFGKAGTMNRYNVLDIRMSIKTNKPGE